MKNTVLARAGLALVMAAALASCGGGGSKYTIGGVVYGLQYGPLVLTTNGMEASVQPNPANTAAEVKEVTYAFPEKLEYGDVYDVIIKQVTDASGNVTIQQPPHQICGPASNSRTSDTAGRLSVISADFVCQLVAPTIGGKVKGLGAGTLVLNNGSDSLVSIPAPTPATTPPADIAYVFPVAVTYGKTYGVTVQTNPAGYTCTVANATGTMRDDPVSNIDVTCVANPT